MAKNKKRRVIFEVSETVHNSVEEVGKMFGVQTTVDIFRCSLFLCKTILKYITQGYKIQAVKGDEVVVIEVIRFV